MSYILVKRTPAKDPDELIEEKEIVLAEGTPKDILR